jgi:G protein-coupled glucose receptor regulating Gpa2
MTAGFNEAQSIALAIVPKISGSLSVLFCALIIFTVARDKNRRSKTYHRLLVGISIVDMSSGFWLALSTWPIPKESTVLWASGNDRTCTLQGFFTNFGITSSFYNTSLSLYFLLVIRYGWKESQIKKIEPFLHVIPLLWGFGTSFAGLGLGIFGNANLWCWIQRKYNVYRWTFFYGPLWTMIVLVSGMSIMIYQYVRQLERRTLKYQYEYEVKSSSDQVSYTLSQQNESRKEKFSEVEEVGLNDKAEIPIDENGCDVAAQIHTSLNADNSLHPTLEKKLQISSPAPIHTIHSDAPSRSFRKSVGRTMLSLIRQPRSDVARLKRTREVASQCFWYAGAFYINWVALSVSCSLLFSNCQHFCILNNFLLFIRL